MYQVWCCCVGSSVSLVSWVGAAFVSVSLSAFCSSASASCLVCGLFAESLLVHVVWCDGGVAWCVVCGVAGLAWLWGMGVAG